MSPLECVHEEDVRSAVNTGRWPERVDAEVRAHVEGCEVCQDTVTVALAFLHVDDFSDETPRPLPDSGTVWLKAQIRARAEANRKAQQPISVFQAVAFAAIVGVLSAILGASSSWLQGLLKIVGSGFAKLDPRGWMPDTAALPSLLSEHLLIVSVLALAIMITPIALYWVTREN
jgi:hypothetical protein